MNVLFLDKEGGFGGSSRSLFLLIKYLDRKSWHPLVVSNEDGPVSDRYRQIEVDHRIHRIPILKPAKRKNSVVLLRFLLSLTAFFRAINYLSDLLKRHKIDVIHFNHDGYFPYAVINKIWWRKKVIFHMRTMLPLNGSSRLHAKLIKACSDHLVFISNNERERFLTLAGPFTHDSVLPNIAEDHSSKESSKPTWLSPFDGRFKVLVLSILAESKGIDRVIDVAREFKNKGWENPILIVCGSERKTDTGITGSQLKGRILAQIRQEGLDHYVYFADFQPNPEPIMSHCDVVLRLSRQNDPWGRDIIEAITNGKPVLATGNNQTYVQQGVHGYLFEPYDPRAIAEKIFFLSKNKQAYAAIREANLKKGEQVFHGPKIARQVESVYRSMRGPKTWN